LEPWPHNDQFWPLYLQKNTIKCVCVEEVVYPLVNEDK
jgi:hypothetical protein